MFISTPPPPPPPSIEVVVVSTMPQPDDPVVIDTGAEVSQPAERENPTPMCGRNGYSTTDFEYGIAPSAEYVQGTENNTVAYCYFIPEQVVGSPPVVQSLALPATGNELLGTILVVGGVFLVAGGILLFIQNRPLRKKNEPDHRQPNFD